MAGGEGCQGWAHTAAAAAAAAASMHETVCSLGCWRRWARVSPGGLQQTRALSLNGFGQPDSLPACLLAPALTREALFKKNTVRRLGMQES